MKKILFVLGLGLVVTVSAQDTKKLEKVAATITPEDLKEKLTVIAGPAMEGRETATPGQKLAAAYIENYFKKLGLKPPTDSGYQSRFTVYQDSLSAASLMINGKKIDMGSGFRLSAASMANGSWSIDSIVFAGFGVMDSTTNDFKGLDVKNKWVIVAEGLPADAEKPAGSVNYNFSSPGSMYKKMYQARSAGAKGMIVIAKSFTTPPPAVYKGNMSMKPSTVNGMPVLSIPPEVAAFVFNKPVSDFAAVKQLEPGTYPAAISFTATLVSNKLESSNVMAVLPGTDKKDEYVFITAHYDHLGKRDSVIYYGADDDGSGTTSVLELAETFVKAQSKGLKNRRSLVFMTVSGEEKGLWGSEYYTQHPLLPLDKTVVDLNIDMVGRIDPERKYGDSMNYIYTIGEDKLSSELMVISDSVNNRFTKLELDRKFNDPKDPNRFYYRSDHFNFAKNGIPVIFYFNGTHADYHRPTDTVEKINFGLMSKRVQLIFYTAYDMANRPAMIRRDIPLKY